MATVVDFSAGLPSPAALKRAGHEGVMLYVSPARESWMRGKQPGREYLDQLDAEGLRYGFVWQFRKGGSLTAGDTGRGFIGGVQDALDARDYLASVGRAERPVFFAVDFNITLGEWNGTVAAYFRGAASILGRDRVGIYGHSRVLAWAQEDGLVAEVAPGRILGWQTKAWSGGELARDYAVLYQRTMNVGGPDGVQVDVNDVWHPGWAPRPGEAPVPQERTSMTPKIRDWTARFNFGGPRKTSAIIGVCIHTTENDPGTPAENVANYQVTSQSGSYHVLADRIGLLVENTDDWTTWSTANKGNEVLLHLSFVFRARYSREQWLAEESMLRAGAWQVAQWCKRYNFPVKQVDVRNLPGITTHSATRAWGTTDHTDPGPNFPWDVFLRYVNEAMNDGGGSTAVEETKGLFMALSEERQNDLAAKIDRIHHELTYQFQSRFKDPKTGERSEFRDTLVGYVLENDVKDEMASRNIPVLAEKLDWLIERMDAIQKAQAELLAAVKGGN